MLCVHCSLSPFLLLLSLLYHSSFTLASQATSNSYQVFDAIDISLDKSSRIIYTLGDRYPREDKCFTIFSLSLCPQSYPFHLTSSKTSAVTFYYKHTHTYLLTCLQWLHMDRVKLQRKKRTRWPEEMKEIQGSTSLQWNQFIFVKVKCACQDVCREHRVTRKCLVYCMTNKLA